MFEKVHSYQFREQMMAEMEDLDGQLFLVPLTIHEKIWLKTILQSKEASLFLSRETIGKLNQHLADFETIQLDSVIQKFQTIIELDDGKIYQFHKEIRDCLSKNAAICLSYQTNDGVFHEKVKGIPFKLEYLANKKQWYVLWYQLNSDDITLLYTPLRQIQSIQRAEVESKVYEKFSTIFGAFIKSKKLKAVISINEKVFQQHSIDEEKQRIFYALSCFEKEVFYDEKANLYEMVVYYRESETENLLQKIRLLGRRVIIKEPLSLKTRMMETAKRVLLRYED